MIAKALPSKYQQRRSHKNSGLVTWILTLVFLLPVPSVAAMTQDEWRKQLQVQQSDPATKSYFDSLKIYSDRAAKAFGQCKYAEAESLYLSKLALLSRLPQTPWQYQETKDCLHALIGIYQARDEHAKVERAYSTLQAMSETGYCPMDKAGPYAHCIASAMERQGRYAQATPIYRSLLQGDLTKGDVSGALSEYLRLVHNLCEQRKYQEADEYCRAGMSLALSKSHGAQYRYLSMARERILIQQGDKRGAVIAFRLASGVCVGCRSSGWVVPLKYGYLTPGGCCVWSDSPKWYCERCHLKF